MKSLFLDKKCTVSAITLAAIRSFGLESTDYEPQILRDLFQQRFGIQKLPQRAFDKLNCGYTLIGTDLYTRSIQVFLTCNGVMANKYLDQNQITYNSLKDVAWGVWQYCNLLGQMQNGKPTQQFSPDIILYIRQVAKTNGIVRFPSWLQFAQPKETYPQELMADPANFQAYMQRQQAQIDQLTRFVTHKQQQMVQQLQMLNANGILG